MRKPGLIALLCLILAGGALAATPSATHVILISMDTTRADSLGGYGCPLPIAPFLDSLARESVQIKDCIVQAPWTLPSHMSLLTSQYPNVHNVNVNVARLAPEKLTLAEHLRNHGYRTTGLHSNPFLNGGFGFSQGFDIYSFVGRQHGFESTGRALEWLEANGRGDPFFLFLHYNDPHIPYQAPDEFYRIFDREYTGEITGTTADIKKYVRRDIDPRDLQQVRSLYRDEVRYLDGQLAQTIRYLKDLGIYDESLIVITSDHGEEFKEHGLLEHNQTLYEEMLRVPLLIKPPARMGIPPGLVDAQVRSIDLMPTILDVLGVPIPEDSVQGSSLVPLMRGRGREGLHPQIFSENSNTKAVSIRSRGWKFIYDREKDQAMLFDLESDPGEQQDQAAAQPAMVAELTRQARDYMVQAQGGWHIRSRYPGEFQVILRTKGRIEGLKQVGVEPKDQVELAPDGRELRLHLVNQKTNDKFDGVDFVLDPPGARLELILPAEAAETLEARLARIRIGRDGRPPKESPVRLNGRRRDMNPDVNINDKVTVDVTRRAVESGLYIWRLDEEAARPLTTELDEETLEGLKSLGYLQ